ncbi:DHHC palmitoyltransferase-domain-containing protein [Nemania sp. FL0916]|nr:DHHC palmitoyltransferase-domain-containing protein [Nemania sp. FL0916]
MPAIESQRAATRWTTRLVPVLLAVAVGYATYVVVARVCVRYLLGSVGKNGAAITLLVLYFIFLALTIITYARTLYYANYDPGVIPLGSRAVERQRATRRRRPERPHSADDIEARAYEAASENDPDSPGLEWFYSRDAFVCEPDGRPKYCSECCTWKHDRVHHSSEIGRCVYRMDHYCPWAGGMIAENSFKFFVQFTTYAAAYCAVVLGATAYALRLQAEHGASADSYLLSVIVIGAFFGLFSFLMTITSLRYIFLNSTNVDILSIHQKVYQLAVRIPRGTTSDRFRVIDYPLSKSEVDPRHRKRGANGSNSNHYQTRQQAESRSANSRDDLATRSFAILETYPGENPWDLGYWRNWQSIMGTSLVDWILPIHHSPCANHENLESLYQMGPMLDQLRSRYGLPAGPPSDESAIMEMRSLRTG